MKRRLCGVTAPSWEGSKASSEIGGVPYRYWQSVCCRSRRFGAAGVKVIGSCASKPVHPTSLSHT